MRNRKTPGIIETTEAKPTAANGMRKRFARGVITIPTTMQAVSAPPAGTLERYRVMEWLSFVSAELHKTFAPLFRPNTPEDYKAISKANLAQRFDWLEKVLDGKQYLTGDKFTAADAYLFVVSRWAPRVGIDLAKWPNLVAFAARAAARPKVQEALKAEGL